MKTLVDHLSSYAGYHRDPRNIATHFVGIPLIVVAVATLLSRPAFASVDVAGVSFALSPATVVIALSIAFYMRLDVRYGLTMAAVMIGSGFLGALAAAQSTTTWLVAGVGSFVVGWIIQFVGHYFEGKKPAFVDDLMGLLVGPLFVVAEAGFAVGFRDDVRAQVEARAGVVRKRAIA